MFYSVSVPVFDKIEMKPGDGKTFTIVKKGKGKNIDKMTIGGARLEGWVVNYDDMSKGKILDIYTK
ncbi:MAG: glycoside hydrolase domain-containing protein [Chitinophagaceae bacterium]